MKEIMVPKNLCLYHNYMGVMPFFKEIEYSVLTERKLVFVDFSLCETMTAAAVLYFVSVVHKCQIMVSIPGCSQGKAIHFKFPSSDYKKENFETTGLWDIIKPGGAGKLKRVAKDDSNPFYTGINPREDYQSAIDKYYGLGLDVLPSKFYSAVQEAYLNILHHSYSLGLDYGMRYPKFLDRRSWYYTYIKEGGDRIVFMLLDRGCGIPAKIKHESSKTGARQSDQKLIERAMKTGFTTTGEPGRGRGSENILKPIKLRENEDTLLVYSGRGGCVYRGDSLIGTHEHLWHFDGTLLEWSLEI